MYTVHMKHVTATEARKSWFRLLDEAAGGELVVIEREGVRLVLQRQDQGHPIQHGLPSYEGLIRADHVERADQWSWDWRGLEDALVFQSREPEQ